MSCGRCGNIVEDVKYLRHQNLCRTCYLQKNRNWRRRNPDYLKTHNQKYYREHSEEIKIQNGLYKDNNPEKIKAHNKLRHAIERGEVLREPCIICGKPAHLHHPDYSKPLEGLWLCAVHHHGAHHGAKEVLERLQSLGITF